MAARSGLLPGAPSERRLSSGLASSFLMHIIFGGITFFLPFVLIIGLYQSVITAGVRLHGDARPRRHGSAGVAKP